MQFCKIAEKYKQQAKFITIYIREAHPQDGWKVSSSLNIKQVNDPKLIEERIELARDFKEDLSYSKNVEIYVDNIQDTGSLSYQSHPERLFIVNPNGKFEFIGGPGPADYSLSKFEEALKGLIEKKK